MIIEYWIVSQERGIWQPFVKTCDSLYGAQEELLLLQCSHPEKRFELRHVTYLANEMCERLPHEQKR